jgi:hypothetical protein
VEKLWSILGLASPAFAEFKTAHNQHEVQPMGQGKSWWDEQVVIVGIDSNKQMTST